MTTTPSSTSSSTSSSPTPETTSVETTAYKPIATKNYTGTGDDVITIDKPADKAAILEFSCPTCDGNVAVKSDNDLLVNEIGAYTGTHLIDIRGDEQTTTLEINADSDWTVKISDIMTAPEDTSGTGDSVIWVRKGTKAAIKHSGEANFAITAASAEGIDLLVNEIGSYSGTVPIDTPGIWDITADGDWTVAPS